MGDMADYALEGVMDAEEDRFRYRMGGMSLETAYDLGIVDEAGGYNHPPYLGQGAPSKVCRYCGAARLHWTETANGWRLADSSGSIHTCNSYQKGAS